MPSAVSLIRSDKLSSVAQYAHAATAPAEARLIFLAGSCPLNADGSTAGIGDYKAQSEKAIENMHMGVTVLGYDHQLVEIEALAAVMDPV
jgi:hypothetical protein